MTHIMHASSCVCLCIADELPTDAHAYAPYLYGVPTHTHRYIHVCMSQYIHSVRVPTTTRCTHTYIPLRIYLCVYAGTCTTYPCAWAGACAGTTRVCLCGGALWLVIAVEPCSSPASPPRRLRRCAAAGARMPLRSRLSASEGLRASQWAPGAPVGLQALRMA